MRRLQEVEEGAGEGVAEAKAEAEVEAKVLLQVAVVVVDRAVQLVVVQRQERAAVSPWARKAKRPRSPNNNNRAKTNTVVGGEATIDVVAAEVVRQKSHSRSEAISA